jgi:hypothetical protein
MTFVARVRVDYTRWLGSPVVEAPLRARQRAGLHIGNLLIVHGEDGIPERKARVLSIVGPKVRLEFVEPLTGRRSD